MLVTDRSSTLHSGTTQHSTSGSGNVNGFGGCLSNYQTTTTSSIGFGDFHSAPSPSAPATSAHFNAFSHPIMSDAHQSERFGGIVSRGTARDFPVSFGGESNSDLLVDFDSMQVTPFVFLTMLGNIMTLLLVSLISCLEVRSNSQANFGIIKAIL